LYVVAGMCLSATVWHICSWRGGVSASRPAIVIRSRERAE
jgi:hypothetical protein